MSMNLLTISTELEKLKCLVDEWNKDGKVPDIEVEIALDRVKNIYTELRMAKLPAVDNFLIEEQKLEPMGSGDDSALQGVFYEVSEENSAANASIQHDKAAQTIGLEELVVPDFPTIGGRVRAEAEVKGLTVEEATPILESISSLADLINSSAQKPTIESFSSDPLLDISDDTTTDDEREPITTYAPPVLNSDEEKAAPKAAAEPQRLGEVLEGHKSFLNEVIQPNRQADLASKLQQKKVSDLNRAISFNDKFLFIKELFKGDAQAYEDTIAKLNSFDTLDKALIYIQDNHSWDATSEAANHLVELLQRKYS